MEEKIAQLFKDETFVKRLFGAESYEAAADMFGEHDIDVTPEELKIAVNVIKEHDDTPITEEELENVSGGTWLLSMGIICGVGFVATIVGGTIKQGGDTF